MSILRKIFSVRGFLIISLIAVNVLIVGCQQSVEGKSALVSGEGVRVEALMPNNVWMVLKGGTDDPVQQKNMKTLMGYFPQDIFKMMQDEMAGSFNENFKEEGLSFEKDFWPALGDNMEFMFAFGGDVANDTEPKMLFVIVPEDALKLVKIMDKAVGLRDEKYEIYKSYTIYSSLDDDMHIAWYEDVLIMGNNVEYVRAALDRASTGQDSLLTNKNYQDGVEKMAGTIGFLFMDPGYVMKQVEKDPEAQERLKEMGDVMDLVAAIEGEFFAFSAEPDGIRIVGLINFDEQKIKELGLDDVYAAMAPAYLYRQLPGENVLVYSESSRLDMSMDILMDVYGEMDELSEVIDMFEEVLAANDIDMEKDLLAFMDKGYAFGIYAGEGILPQMGVFIDATSSPEGAKKVMGKVFEGIEGFIGEMREELEGIVVHGKADCGTGECYALTFAFDNLPEDAKVDMPEDFVDKVVEFGYGLNSDNLAYFALYPDFGNSGFETMDNNERFNEDRKYIAGFDQQVTYMDIEMIMEYVDRWVQFAIRIDGGEPGEMEDYEMVKKYVKPVKSLILGSKEAEGGMVEMQGFLKIAQ